jgi:hypothetical protein
MNYYIFGWIIPAIAVGGGLVWLILNSYWKSRRTGDSSTQKAVDEHTATNKAVLDKLDSIDSRLTAVEKTLNDIPN